LRDEFSELLRFKPSYRRDMVHATTSLRLGKDHAAGITNWFEATGADSVYPKYGAVYKVTADPLYPDLGIGEDHCCQLIHDDKDWCAFRARELVVTEVVHDEVHAAKSVTSGAAFTFWPGLNNRSYVDVLRQVYDLWRKKNGCEWYWG
jgi:hypothetical protein